MKKYVAILALLAMPALAMAGTANTLDLLSGGSSTVAADPGSSITVNVVLDTTEPQGVAGYGLSATASSAGVFDITSETRSVIVAFPSGSAVGGLDVTSPVSSCIEFVNVPAGSFPATILTWEVAVDANAAAGDYTIIASGPGISTTGGVAIPVTLGALTVTVTPEPATMLLLAGALPFLRRRRMA